MSFDSASAEAGAYADALAALCEHYEVPVDSANVALPGHDERVHYLTTGEGPPLVALHGIGSTAASWVPLLDALRDRFTVYVPERPGRGLSTPVDYERKEYDFRRYGVDYVVAFLDALGLDSVDVLANSLGGFQSLALSIDHPERLKRQCLVGAPAGLSRKPPLLMRLLGTRRIGDWLASVTSPDTVEEARETYRRINVEDDSALPDVFFEVGLRGEEIPGRTDSVRSLTRAIVGIRGSPSRFDLREPLQDCTVPTRFIWGTEDYFWGPEVGRAVARSMPDAELVTLDGHGHTPWLEPTNAAEREIRTFLDSND